MCSDVCMTGSNCVCACILVCMSMCVLGQVSVFQWLCLSVSMRMCVWRVCLGLCVSLTLETARAQSLCVSAVSAPNTSTFSVSRYISNVNTALGNDGIAMGGWGSDLQLSSDWNNTEKKTQPCGFCQNVAEPNTHICNYGRMYTWREAKHTLAHLIEHTHRYLKGVKMG